VLYRSRWAANLCALPSCRLVNSLTCTITSVKITDVLVEKMFLGYDGQRVLTHVGGRCEFLLRVFAQKSQGRNNYVVSREGQTQSDFAATSIQRGYIHAAHLISIGEEVETSTHLMHQSNRSFRASPICYPRIDRLQLHYYYLLSKIRSFSSTSYISYFWNLL
jgi:hypothetical protein